nr:CehA/McbA family metallohydrolase [uncultured Rhodopila sp.]
MTLLAPFAAPGRFYKGNLHTHSTRSDGALDPVDVCAAYREAGYDFLALTDHFLEKFGFPITDTRPFRSKGFTTLIGAEVHAPATEFGELWHILSVGLPLDFEPTATGESGPALAARCAAAGAFVTIAHPAWYGLTIADAETIPGAHAIEVYNHTSAVRTDRGDGWGLLDAMLARGHRLTACATDDAHFKCNDYFGGWMMVKADSLEPEALLAALLAGHSYATQGPEIHAIAIDGEDVTIECSPASSVILLGRATATAVVFGSELRQARLKLDCLKPGGYGRIVVTDAVGRRAWSSPFWPAEGG